MSRVMLRDAAGALVLFSALILPLGPLSGQTFDLDALDSESNGGSGGGGLSALLDDMDGQPEWKPFQLTLVWGSVGSQIFEWDDMHSLARNWHETMLPNTSSGELEFRLNQMNNNNMFYLNNEENYAGRHRGIRLTWQSEEIVPIGLFAGVHMMPIQWQGSGTSAEGETVAMNSTLAQFQPLVDEFLYLRQIYNYYIPEEMSLAAGLRMPHVELGVSKNLGDWVQIGVSALLAPGAENAIVNWHEDIVAGLDEPQFALNPGAGIDVPMSFSGFASVRYSSVSLGVNIFMQPAPETPAEGQPLNPIQYGTVVLGYAF